MHKRMLEPFLVNPIGDQHNYKRDLSGEPRLREGFMRKYTVGQVAWSDSMYCTVYKRHQLLHTLDIINISRFTQAGS